MKTEQKRPNAPLEDMEKQGKKLPQAPDMERAVIAAMMVESACIPQVAELLEAEMFYLPQHATIYTAIMWLHRNNLPVDLLTVAEALGKAGQLRAVGGRPYLAQLAMTVGSAANVAAHAAVVVEKHILRSAMSISDDTMRRGYEDSEDVADILGDAMEGLKKSVYTIERACMPQHIGALAQCAVNETKQRCALRQEAEDLDNMRADGSRTAFIFGIPSGLPALDIATGGWNNGNLIILAARPSVGKTALSLWFALAAAKSGKHALFFSAEMSCNALAHRILLMQSGIDADKYRRYACTAADLEHIDACQRGLSAIPLYLHNATGMTMEAINNKATIMNDKGQCSIIFIDYLQMLATKAQNRPQNREQEVAGVCHAAKRMALSLNVPVVLLSQLNRESMRRADATPRLSDLRDSGSIEQDADVVVFISRSDYGSCMASMEHEGKLIVAKNRDGRTSTVPFRHNGSMTHFEDFGGAGMGDGLDEVFGG